MTAALALSGIAKSFDGFPAITLADLEVRGGEVHALLGENGAGKSSLMNIAAGLYAPDDGTIQVHGQRVSIKGPLDARQLGIGMVHQHYKLVRTFSALENIMLANPEGGFARGRAGIEAKVRRLAEEIGFTVDLARPVGALSIAEQQRVEILKMLVGGARILILDEPTAVLTDMEAEGLLKMLRQLAAQGAAVILVTHKLGDVMRHADRLTVMRNGRTVATADPGTMTAGELTKLVVGTTATEGTMPAKTIHRPVLSLSNICSRGNHGRERLHDVTMEIRGGEIYGLAGVGGNGQTELAEILMGVALPGAGEIRLQDGIDITRSSPRARRAHGLAVIPADRHAFGLAGELSIADNYIIGEVLCGKYGGIFRLNSVKAQSATSAALTAFDVQGVRGPGQKAALLSGGNAQKLVIAREFAGTPKVIVAHSPSRGLDVRAAAAVHARLRAARDAGAGVLLISEDLDEILLLADRIGVLNRGKLVAEYRAPVERQAVGEAMVGHG
jgi:ABC-type uncharacterized transport system ATPase subunit